jgi:radical SAM protein with 4Fe4S-binding SPASM domain
LRPEILRDTDRDVGTVNRLRGWLARDGGTLFYQVVRQAPARPIYNRLRRVQHKLRYGVDSVSMFRNVELEVNSMCNRTCSYCPNVSAKRPVGYMHDDLFRKIIDELGAFDFDGTVSYHFYGEPLLDKRLPELVAYTKRVAPHCSPGIYSNGDLLTLEMLRDYIARGLSWFCITQHDNQMPANLQRIFDEATEDEKRHVEMRFARTIQMNNRSGLVAGFGARAPLTTPCDWPLGTMVITKGGNVLPCCNDYFETEIIGNVETHSLREVWCSERFEHFRQALASGDRTHSRLCESCDAVPSPHHLARIVPQ